MQTHYGSGVHWIDPSYIAVYHVLTNPVYAGAYAYGKSRHEVTLDASGARKKRVRKLPRSQWSVLLPNHHQGFIDWSTYESNRRPVARQALRAIHSSGVSRLPLIEIAGPMRVAVPSAIIASIAASSNGSGSSARSQKMYMYRRASVARAASCSRAHRKQWRDRRG